MSHALPLHIETLDRRGHIVSRTRIDHIPATIGRGYHCNIIVDDAYCAATHVNIELDAQGELLMRDAGTQNGISTAGSSVGKATATAKVSVLPVRGVTDFVIGKTRLRAVPADAPIAPERTLTLERSVPIGVVAGAVTLLLALTGFESWFSMINEVKPVTIITALLALLGVLFIWAGGWAFITRLMQGAPKLGIHVLIATVGLIALQIGSLIVDTLGFSFNLSALVRWRLLLGALLGALLLGAHVYVVNGALSRWTMSIIGLVTAGVLAMGFLNNYQSYKTISPGGFMSNIFPPSWQLSGSRGADDFYTRVRSDKADVDALRAIEGDQDGGGVE
jgi:hypothetical protein